MGRYREAGIDELVFYWPIDSQTFQRAPAFERALERIAATVLPSLRRPALA